MKPKQTGAFCDQECTCQCGNKHELYGGKGYTTIYREGWSDGRPDGGFYHHKVRCNTCGAICEFCY